ncbi:hypothetical protein MY04_4450 [Flammeovirga sp. MY04]|nr:hypothetical protein MY04_4450 [Flammeovirga sp. MY04]
MINNFIREVDSTAYVYLDYREDYCNFYEKDSVFMSYTSSLEETHKHNYYYDIQFEDREALTIKYQSKKFSINRIMKLIDYGLKNKENLKNKSLPKRLPSSKNSQKYQSKKAKIDSLTSSIDEVVVESFLQNDSIHLVLESRTIVIDNIRKIDFDTTHQILLIQTKKNEILLIELKDQFVQKLINLPFNIGCLDEVNFRFKPFKNQLKVIHEKFLSEPQYASFDLGPEIELKVKKLDYLYLWVIGVLLLVSGLDFIVVLRNLIKRKV